MRRSPRLSWLRLAAASLLLAAGSSQAQRVTEIPAGPEFDRGIACPFPYCSATVSALDGNTAVMTGAGVGVLVRSAPDVWNLQQELWNPDAVPASPSASMGYPAAVSGDVLLATGTSRIYNLKPVIYVWKRSGTTWTHTQVLAPPRPAGFDKTAVASVQLDQTTAAVCTVQRDTAATRAQAQIDLYVLKSNGRFVRQAQLIPPLTLQQGNRCHLALEGNTLLVGDPLADLGNGRVLVYERGSAGWILRRRLAAADSTPGALFGTSADISGNTIVAGAPGRPNFDQPRHPGAAYVFQRTATGWAQIQVLVKPVVETDPPIPEESHPIFGELVSVSGDRLVTTWNSSDFLLSQTYLYERRGVWAPVAGLVTYPELSSVRVYLSGSVAIQTMNVMISFPHELPPLWTLPPRVEGP
ncbi:MAG TPA: FG-GAP repeat protein [Povalibacter sp.]